MVSLIRKTTILCLFLFWVKCKTLLPKQLKSLTANLNSSNFGFISSTVAPCSLNSSSVLFINLSVFSLVNTFTFPLVFTPQCICIMVYQKIYPTFTISVVLVFNGIYEVFSSNIQFGIHGTVTHAFRSHLSSFFLFLLILIIY